MTAEASATEQALRDELAQCQARLAVAEADLEDVFRIVGHDLRAPLRHLTAYSQLIREEVEEGAGAEQLAPYLGTLEGAARKLGRMIDGVLAFSRAGRAPLVPATVDMGALLREARAMLQPEAAGRAVAWQIADDWPAVRGDAALLRELWQVLLSNALKFTRPQAEPRIAVGWRRVEAGLECQVRDNGVGFNPAQAGQLFGMFRRLHRENEFDGVGTGLALAQRIVVRHGGHIEATAEPGAGCTVRFVLPQAEAA